MKYEVIFFDADETLFDFKKSETFALDKLMDNIDTDHDKEHCIDIYKKVNKKIWEEFEKGLISSDDLKVERFKGFASEINLACDAQMLSDMYVEFLGDGSFLYEETTNLLDYLHEKYKISIITNGLSSVQNRRIRNSVVGHYFNDVVISDELKIAKPNPEIFNYALKNLNHDNRSTVLMIGDSLSSDIKGGINANIDTCWFNPDKKENLSEAIPKFEIHSLLDLKNIL